MAKITKKDLTAIRDQIARDGLTLHITTASRESAWGGYNVRCRFWRHDGITLAQAGGCGYDKRGTALGEALTVLFSDRIEALQSVETVTRESGYVAQLRGVCKAHATGKVYLEGGAGFECMLDVLRALGFKVETYDTGRDSCMIVAEPKAPAMTPSQAVVS